MRRFDSVQTILSFIGNIFRASFSPRFSQRALSTRAIRLLCAAESVLRLVCRRIFPVFIFSRYIYCFRWEKIKQNGNFGKKFLNFFLQLHVVTPQSLRFSAPKRSVRVAPRSACDGKRHNNHLLALTNFSAIALLEKRREKRAHLVALLLQPNGQMSARGAVPLAFLSRTAQRAYRRRGRNFARISTIRRFSAP